MELIEQKFKDESQNNDDADLDVLVFELIHRLHHPYELHDRHHLSELRERNEPEDHLKAAAAWSLGQIGRHSPDHAKFLSEADVPSRLLAVYMLPESSKDLKDKSKKSLKNIIQMCTHLPALEPLLQLAPNNILTYVTAQFAKVLPSNLEAKRTFVQSGGFQKIQEI